MVAGLGLIALIRRLCQTNKVADDVRPPSDAPAPRSREEGKDRKEESNPPVEREHTQSAAPVAPVTSGAAAAAITSSKDDHKRERKGKSPRDHKRERKSPPRPVSSIATADFPAPPVSRHRHRPAGPYTAEMARLAVSSTRSRHYYEASPPLTSSDEDSRGSARPKRHTHRSRRKSESQGGKSAHIFTLVQEVDHIDMVKLHVVEAIARVMQEVCTDMELCSIKPPDEIAHRLNQSYGAPSTKERYNAPVASSASQAAWGVMWMHIPDITERLKRTGHDLLHYRIDGVDHALVRRSGNITPAPERPAHRMRMDDSCHRSDPAYGFSACVYSP